MWTRFCNALGNFSICCCSFTLNAFYLSLVIPIVSHSHIKTKRELLRSHQFQPQPQTINTLSQTFVSNKYEYYMNHRRLTCHWKLFKVTLSLGLKSQKKRSNVFQKLIPALFLTMLMDLRMYILYYLENEIVGIKIFHFLV